MTTPTPTPPFGNQTVGFVTQTQTGTPGSLGEMPTDPTTVDVPGCRHRPLSVAETPDVLIDIATQVWKTTAPPVDAVVNAKANGQLTVDGKTYQIVGGPQVFPDAEGNAFKVTLLSQVQVG